MKKICFLLFCAMLFACTPKSEHEGDVSKDNSSVLRVGALREFKRSTEGASLVFDTLLKMTPDCKILPNIITDWTVNDTATEYLLTIRSDVKFTDGSKLTAEEVKWSIENVSAFMWCNSAYLFEEVSVVDESHVKVSLTAPYSFFPMDLTSIFVMKENSLDDAMSITNFIGCGPYILQESDDSPATVLVRNDDYWNKEKLSEIAKVEWYVIKDANARRLALSSNKIDVLGISEHFLSIEYSSIDSLLKNKEYSFIEENKDAFTSIVSIGFNWKEGFCSDRELRRALEYGINREALVNTVFFGVPEVCGHQFNPKFADGPKNEKPYYYDFELASKILDDAGYVDSDNDGVREKNGENVVLKFVISSTQDFKRDLAVFVKSELEKLGIGCEIVSASGEHLKEHLKSGDYNLSLQAPWFEPIVGSISYFGFDDNYTEYGLTYVINDETIAAGKSLVQAKNEAEVRKYSDALWKEQYKDCVTLPICTTLRIAIYNPEFEGFKFTGNVFTIDLSDVKKKCK